MNNILNTDSYKASHWKQYPPGTEGVFSYIESRGGVYPYTLVYGLQIFLKEVLSKPISLSDIENAKRIFEAHGEPFNEDGWRYILKNYGGYLPLKIKAVPEGTVVPTGNIILSIENLDPKLYWLTSYVETALLRAVWYPTTVATISYSIKQVIKQYMEETGGDVSGLGFKLHDFGARGVSSRESAMIGGSAHLVNFMGTDTVEALLPPIMHYAMEDVQGFSIPAAEHSTITSWGRENEVEAYRNMLNQYKDNGILAVVSDSYDIYNACEHIWGDTLKQEVIDSGAIVVVRPDSGNPVEVVGRVLEILDSKFGSTVNEKGYKLLNNVRVIQGDGINETSITAILDRAKSLGFSADNLAFGMGGALLQHCDRDTQKWAMKCSAMKINGEWKDVWKDPITDKGKGSKRGRLTLVQDDSLNYRTVTENAVGDQVEVLETVFENGRIVKEYTFDEIRERANKA